MRIKYIFIRILIVLCLILGAVGSVYYFLTEYRIEKINFSGVEFSSKAEILDLAQEGYLGDNSIYLTRKFKETPVTTIPFVDAIDIHADSHKEITVVVYEKLIVGSVEFNGRYYFFDKDGNVADALSFYKDNIVLVEGLDLPYINVGEKLPINNDRVLQGILSIAKLLTKYSLDADKIYVKSDGGLVLYFGSIRVDVGNSLVNVEDKFTLIEQFLDMLEGQSGVLDLTGTSETYVFTKDVEKTVITEEIPEEE